VLVSCRVRLFSPPSRGRSIELFALPSRWFVEPGRVAKDNESLRIETLAFGKTEDEFEAESTPEWLRRTKSSKGIAQAIPYLPSV
jgi:hypothetical protein